MKKNFRISSFLILIALVCAFTGYSQPAPVPTAPSSLQFADLTVRFDDGARRIVQQDITALVQSNRKYWQAKLDRVVLYFPLIEAVLQNEGVPVDFKYLAVQESSLTPDAVSASTAVGYWQFKKETATDHGMRVDDEVDERKSIIASTRGAARYLKRSNGVYNNWVSALFSYYLGMGGISKLVSPDWTYAKDVTLSDRTDRYILRFFAHKIAFENVLPSYQTANTFTLVAYAQGSGKNVAQIAQELKVDEQELRRYNRWILGDDIPSDKDYALAIPVQNGASPVARSSQAAPAPVVTASAPARATRRPRKEGGFPILRKVNYAGKPGVVLYEINGLPGIQAQRGDNASTLARKARVSLSSLLRYNDMSDLDAVTEGEVYYLAKKMRKAIVPRHTTGEGETVRSVSQMYGVRLKKLLRYNRIDQNQRLQAGRVMWLQQRRPKNEPVEIINVPDGPSEPTSRPVADQEPISEDTRLGATQPMNRPANAGSVPKNASERKRYTPKLVDVTPEPEAPLTAPGSNSGTVSRPIAAPTPGPAPTRPADVVEPSAPIITSTNSGNTQRVVIVRPEGQSSAPVASQPTYSSPSPSVSTPPATRPAPAPKQEEPRLTTSRPQPTEPAVTATPAPARSQPARTEPSATAAERRSVTHKVEAGQTYYSISRQYGVTVNDLLVWNNRTVDDKLAVGQSLLIKGTSEAAQNPPARSTISTPSASAPVGEDIIYHTVQKGETMFGISRQYGVSVDQIQTWNQLSEGGVKVGQQLKIIKK